MSLISPEKPNHIPKSSQWLGGVGSGSWFYIKKEQEKYRIERFSKEGEKEFTGLFKPNNDFYINQDYQFTYLSHYQFCTLIQYNKKIVFHLYN